MLKTKMELLAILLDVWHRTECGADRPPAYLRGHDDAVLQIADKLGIPRAAVCEEQTKGRKK